MRCKFIAFLLISLFISTGYAETTEELYESLAQKKRDLIASTLDASEGNNEFWKVYNQYEEKRSGYDLEALRLIRKFKQMYAEGEIEFQSMVNMQAAFFRIEGRILQNKQNHAEFFANTIPKKDVLRLYMLEKNIDAHMLTELHQKPSIISPEIKLD